MSGQSTTWFRQQRLQETFRRVALPFTQVQIALTRKVPAANADINQLDEPGPNGYARVTYPFNAASWTLANGTEMVNASRIVFPRASGTGWGMLNGFVLIAVGPNRTVAVGTLVQPLRCVGGVQPVFEIGSIAFGEREA